MAKNKLSSTSLFSKNLSNKQVFVTSVIAIIIFITITFLYTLYQFNNSGYTSRDLFKTFYWNIVGIYYNFLPSSSQPPTAINPVTPTAEPTLPPLTSEVYTSNNLGISFSYPTYIPVTSTTGMHFYTKEIGDTVYLYDNLSTNQLFTGSDAEFLKTIAQGAYSVEVFTKDPNQSLTDAIKQRFLTGYSEADCIINTNYEKGYPRDDKSLVTAAISIHFPINTVQERDARMAKCPGGYTEGGNGILYFMMDTKHPDKLLFVRVGQSNIPSGEGGSWDGTIKVLQ